MASTRLCLTSALLLVVACGGGESSPDAAPMQPDAAFPATVACGADVVPSGPVALAKNIIIVMGDGMGPAQIQAGRMTAGRDLSFEALSEPTYVNTDSLTTDTADNPEINPTDSAAAATALATGTRVVNEVLSVDGSGQPIETVAEKAKAAGKAIGLVTTSFVHDASTMAWVAHAASRDDHDLLLNQLLSTAKPDVILGGGQSFFDANAGAYAAIAESEGYHIVRTAAELSAWNPSNDPMVLGLFQGSQLSDAPELYEWYTTPAFFKDGTETDPPLADMALSALGRLSSDTDGFFLFVEDEHTDTIGHIAIYNRDTAPAWLPPEVLEVDKTVTAIISWIEQNSSWDDTLLVVLADHETGGYTLYGDDTLDAVFWASPLHSQAPVAIYAKGPGADTLASACRISDVHWLFTGQLPAQ